MCSAARQVHTHTRVAAGQRAADGSTGRKKASCYHSALGRAAGRGGQSQKPGPRPLPGLVAPWPPPAPPPQTDALPRRTGPTCSELLLELLEFCRSSSVGEEGPSPHACELGALGRGGGGAGPRVRARVPAPAPRPGLRGACCLCDLLGACLGRPGCVLLLLSDLASTPFAWTERPSRLLSPACPPAVGHSLPSPARPAPAPAPTPVRIRTLSRLRTTVKVGDDNGKHGKFSMACCCGGTPIPPGGRWGPGRVREPGSRAVSWHGGLPRGAHSAPEVQRSPSVTAVATPYPGPGQGGGGSSGLGCTHPGPVFSVRLLGHAGPPEVPVPSSGSLGRLLKGKAETGHLTALQAWRFLPVSVPWP